MNSEKKNNFLKAYNRIFKLYPEEVNGVHKYPTYFNYNKEKEEYNINYVIDGKEYKNVITKVDLENKERLGDIVLSHMKIDEDLEEGLIMLGVKDIDSYKTFSFKSFKNMLGEILWLKYTDGEFGVLDNLYLKEISNLGFFKDLVNSFDNSIKGISGAFMSIVDENNNVQGISKHTYIGY